MSAFRFAPAVREKTPLLIGLVGPSGSGKTVSALRLASGIQSIVGGEIAVIDTEARRALHHANKFKFLHLQFDPPHSSERYLDALRAALETGARTIVIDSMSHEHEGEGGLLEYHEAELDRLAGDDWKKRDACNFLAWAKPKGARRRLINGLLQMNANFVFCFRAKEKIKMAKQDGKTKPVEAGWQAIAGDEFVYEMTARLLLPPGAQGKPSFDEESMQTGVPKVMGEHREFIREGRRIDEKMGADFARWASGSTITKPSDAFDEEAFVKRLRQCTDRDVLGVCADEIRSVHDEDAKERLFTVYRECKAQLPGR